MFGVGGGGAGGAPLASFWYLRPLGSCFAWFLAAMAGILFLGGGLGAGLCLHPFFKFC